jgi:hypothetical protein
MKTICCALHQRKQKRKDKTGSEIIGFTRSGPQRKRGPRRRPFLLFDDLENDVLAIAESLDEREKKTS